MNITPAQKAELVETLQVVAIGHVDVGKSSLVGRLYVQFGRKDEVDKKMAEVAKSTVGRVVSGDATNVEYRHLCDSAKAERTKGNTINYHTTAFTLKCAGQPDRFTSVCDAPGHVEYSKNCIAGISRADMALFVVPASAAALNAALGPMEMNSKSTTKSGKKLPCVLDHQLRLLATFGVKTLLVLVNKMGGGTASQTQSGSQQTQTVTDIVPWNEKNFTEICQNVAARVKSNGFDPSWVNYMPIDVFGTDNLWEKSKNMPWWKGIDFNPKVDKSPYKPAPFHADTLAEYLCKITVPARALDAPLRMCVNNNFNLKGVGRINSCKVFGGTCTVDQEIFVSPENLEGKVKSLEIHRTSRTIVGAGDEVGVILTVKGADIAKGSVIAQHDMPALPVKCFTALLTMCQVQETIREGFSCVMDIQVIHATVVLERILGVLNEANPKMELTGTEPECLTWNPVLTQAEIVEAKRLSMKKKQDPKFKPTAEQQFLIDKMNDPFKFKKCGLAFLDERTAPMECCNRTKRILVRIRPLQPIVLAPYAESSGLGRFCLRNDCSVIAIGVVLNCQYIPAEVSKKGKK